MRRRGEWCARVLIVLVSTTTSGAQRPLPRAQLHLLDTILSEFLYNERAPENGI